MSKAVLISIRQKWCELIASGKKTIEVRKTAPKLKTPFKCYIYCTKGAPYLNRHNGKLYLEPKDSIGGQGYGLYERLSGKVIGEFVCDRIYGIIPDENGWGEEYGYSEHDCLSDAEMAAYLGDRIGLLGWHISSLVIYDEPMKLNDFMRKPCDFAASCGACNHAKWLSGHRFDGCELTVTRPPQSFCYVEELS